MSAILQNASSSSSSTVTESTGSVKIPTGWCKISGDLDHLSHLSDLRYTACVVFKNLNAEEIDVSKAGELKNSEELVAINNVPKVKYMVFRYETETQDGGMDNKTLKLTLITMDIGILRERIDLWKELYDVTVRLFPRECASPRFEHGFPSEISNIKGKGITFNVGIIQEEGIVDLFKLLVKQGCVTKVEATDFINITSDLISTPERKKQLESISILTKEAIEGSTSSVDQVIKEAKTLHDIHLNKVQKLIIDQENVVRAARERHYERALYNLGIRFSNYPPLYLKAIEALKLFLEYDWDLERTWQTQERIASIYRSIALGPDLKGTDEARKYLIESMRNSFENSVQDSSLLINTFIVLCGVDERDPLVQKIQNIETLYNYKGLSDFVEICAEIVRKQNKIINTLNGTISSSITPSPAESQPFTFSTNISSTSSTSSSSSVVMRESGLASAPWLMTYGELAHLQDPTNERAYVVFENSGVKGTDLNLTGPQESKNLRESEIINDPSKKVKYVVFRYVKEVNHRRTDERTLQMILIAADPINSHPTVTFWQQLYQSTQGLGGYIVSNDASSFSDIFLGTSRIIGKGVAFNIDIIQEDGIKELFNLCVRLGHMTQAEVADITSIALNLISDPERKKRLDRISMLVNEAIDPKGLIASADEAIIEARELDGMYLDKARKLKLTFSTLSGDVECAEGYYNYERALYNLGILFSSHSRLYHKAIEVLELFVDDDRRPLYYGEANRMIATLYQRLAVAVDAKEEDETRRRYLVEGMKASLKVNFFNPPIEFINIFIMLCDLKENHPLIEKIRGPKKLPSGYGPCALLEICAEIIYEREKIISDNSRTTISSSSSSESQPLIFSTDVSTSGKKIANIPNNTDSSTSSTISSVPRQ